MVISWTSRDKRSLRQLKKQTREKGLAMRCQIVLLAGRRRSRERIAESVGCAVSWVGAVRRRYRSEGIEALADRRADNGERKVDQRFLVTSGEVLDQSPEDFRFPRPTWTRELLVKVLKRKTGVCVHVTTMSRALRAIGARRGRPRPTVGCPGPEAQKARRLREIQRVLGTLPRNEVAVYEDEADLPLNPKIGLDWMNRSTQKTVLTPGQNQKRYVAGALDSRTRRRVWVIGQHKTAILFLLLLWKLHETYPRAKKIQVILDNFRIHSSAEVQSSLNTPVGRRFVLHFLPPYCPDHNKIERVWPDLHANVTRNHRCRSMADLIHNVHNSLNRRNRRPPSTILAKPSLQKPKRNHPHFSRTVI
jgi:transposase